MPETRGHNRLIGVGVPDVAHAAGVGIILLEHGLPETPVVAGILRDVLEDTPVTFELLAETFGAEVAELVRAESEPDKSLPWRERKTHTFEHLKSAPLDVRLVAAADKLHNVQSIMADLELVGPDLRGRFNAPFADQSWYYHGVSRAVRGTDPEALPLFVRLHEAVEVVFGPHREPAAS